MGTRSVIARPAGDAWQGRACHYDGYPDHQGRVLFDAVTGHFAGDIDAACRTSSTSTPPAGASSAATSPSRPASTQPATRATATSATATATATSRPRACSTPTPPAPAPSSTPTSWDPTRCACCAPAVAAGTSSPSLAGTTSPTGAPSSPARDPSATGARRRRQPPLRTRGQHTPTATEREPPCPRIPTSHATPISRCS